MIKNKSGFAVLESLLILIIVAIIGGIGWYAVHTKHQTDSILSNANKISQSIPSPAKKTGSSASTQTNSQKYLTITQWGVRSAYSGNLSLEYSIKDTGSSPAVATFSSAQLDASDSGCADKTFGGQIDRYRSTDMMYFGGTISNQSAAEYAATLDNSDYAHVGNYYYFFEHSQTACGTSDNSNNLETQTNNDVKSLLSALQTVPQ